MQKRKTKFFRCCKHVNLQNFPKFTRSVTRKKYNTQLLVNNSYHHYYYIVLYSMGGRHHLKSNCRHMFAYVWNTKCWLLMPFEYFTINLKVRKKFFLPKTIAELFILLLIFCNFTSYSHSTQKGNIRISNPIYFSKRNDIFLNSLRV